MESLSRDSREPIEAYPSPQGLPSPRSPVAGSVRRESLEAARVRAVGNKRANHVDKGLPGGVSRTGDRRRWAHVEKLGSSAV